MKKPDWWLRFEVEVKSSKVYIACWSRPVSNAPLRTRLSYFAILMILPPVLVFMPPLIVEYNTLEEMEKKSVVIIGTYCECGRRGDGAFLVFSERGEKKEAQIAGRYNRISKIIENNIGQQATIWVDYRDRLIEPYHLIRQMVINDNRVLSYRYPTDKSVKKANEDWYDVSVKITFYGLGLSIILFLYVILRLGRPNQNRPKQGATH